MFELNLRLNIVLLLAAIASSLYLVHTQYESRSLFAQLDRAKSAARNLEIEHQRLQVEKRAQSAPQRIEALAREQGMLNASPAITQYLSVSPAPTPAATTGSAATSTQP